MTRSLRRIGNAFVIALLRSPLHRLASRSLLLLSYRGRRSGRRITMPVVFAEDEEGLVVFVGGAERKRWWRNMRGGSAVDVRLRGRTMHGMAKVVADGAAARTYVERFPKARAAIENADAATFVRVSELQPGGAL
jgi:F420H(2)-dependent quinone reductase